MHLRRLAHGIAACCDLAVAVFLGWAVVLWVLAARDVPLSGRVQLAAPVPGLADVSGDILRAGEPVLHDAWWLLAAAGAGVLIARLLRRGIWFFAPARNFHSFDAEHARTRRRGLARRRRRDATRRVVVTCARVRDTLSVRSWFPTRPPRARSLRDYAVSRPRRSDDTR